MKTRTEAAAIERACNIIFLQWSRFAPEPDARHQAETFRARFAPAPIATSDAELDRTLAAVADAMALA